MKLFHSIKAATLSCVMLLGSITNANAVPMLSFVDSSTGLSNVTIDVGQTVTMDLMITGAFTGGQLLEAGDIGYSYDASGAVGISGSPANLNPANSYVFSLFDPVPAHDAVANTVNFVFSMPFMDTTTPRLGGDIKLASVTFIGEIAGSTASLSFLLGSFLTEIVGGTITQLNNVDLTALATIKVNAVPLPAAVWMLGSGLIGLMGFGRLRRKSSTELVAA